MANNTAIIDLSELPVPDAVVVPDSAALFATWLEQLQAADETYNALVASDPGWKQGEIVSYNTTLLYQKVNDAVRAVLLASANGADLDQIGGNFNVPRQIITPGDPDAVPPVDPVYESNDAYRERIQLSWAQLNTAGALNAYRYHATSADPDVLDAEAYGPDTHDRPGEVDVYVLSRTGDGTASEELLATVNAALNEDEVRPLTDYVHVYSALLSPYVVEATLEIPAGPDASTVLENAQSELDTYLDELHRIGAVVPISGIYHALHQPGVTRVTLVQPVADIEPTTGTAPYCTQTMVTMEEVVDDV